MLDFKNGTLDPKKEASPVERLTQNFTDGWDDSKIFVEMNTSEFFRFTRKVALVVMLDGHHHYGGVGGD